MLIQGFNSVTSLPAVTAGLLPALHDAGVSDVTAVPADLVASAGNVYRNSSSGALTIPAAMGRAERTVDVNGFFGCDGRLFYPVEREPDTTSYYPSEFSRELFTTSFSEEMLKEGQTIRLSFAVDMRTYVANTMCQWVVQLQIGQRTSDDTPNPTGLNLKGFTWLPYSMQHAITFGAVAQQHLLGMQIQRVADSAGVAQYRANALKFNVLSSCQAPTASNFVIRARLAQFDTENGVVNPKGFVAYQLTQGKMEIA